jgi:hypothetical protein
MIPLANTLRDFFMIGLLLLIVIKFNLILL